MAEPETRRKACFRGPFEATYRCLMHFKAAEAAHAPYRIHGRGRYHDGHEFVASIPPRMTPAGFQLERRYSLFRNSAGDARKAIGRFGGTPVAYQS